jgi:signal transduction histidine kinase
MTRKSPIVRLAALRKRRLRSLQERVDAEARVLALSIISRVASSLAHDFKHDIGTIWNCTELLESEHSAAGRDDVNDACDAIRAAGRAVLRRLERLLSMTDHREPWEQVLSLTSSVSRFASKVETSCAAQQIDLSVVLPAGEVLVVADPDQIQFVLEILFDNSREALDRRKEERSIQITVHSNEHEVLLFWRDNGRGMDPVTREHCLEPFFTTRASGIGLGLFVAQTILKRRGGRIEVESCEGEGTCLMLTLPRPATAEIE